MLQGDGLRAQLLRGGIGSLAVKAGHAVLTFAVAVVLARTLGPEGYGVYSFALAILMLTAIPAQVGVPQLVVRETAKAQADDNYGLMRGLWRWGNITVALLSLAAFLVMGVILLFTDVGADGARAATLIVGSVLIPVIALANIRGACLRGLRRVVQGQLPESIVRPALLLALVSIWAAFVVPEKRMTAQQAMGLYVTAAVIAFVIGVWLLRRSQPLELSDKPSPAYDFIAWRKAVIPLALLTGLQLINTQADLIILGVFRSDAEVGIYRVVTQFGLLVLFGFHFLGKVLQPYFASLHRNGRTNDLLLLYRNSQMIIALFSIPVLLLFFLFGEVLLTLLFGDEYGVGWLALIIYGLAKLFHAQMGISWDILNMTGNESITLRVATISMAINILASVILVPVYGIEGSAFSSLMAFMCFSGVMWIHVRKHIFDRARKVDEKNIEES